MRLAVRNLLRRKLRSSFALLGIGIGIAAVVSIVSTSRGLQRQFRRIADSYSRDLVVSAAEGASPLMSRIPAVVVEALRDMPHIDGVSTLRIHAFHLPDYSGAFVVQGLIPGEPLLDRYHVVAGRGLSVEPRREILIGRLAAETLNLKPGDELRPDSEGTRDIEPYEVVGIFETEVAGAGGFLAGQGIVHGDYLGGEVSSITASMLRAALPMLITGMGRARPSCTSCGTLLDARALAPMFDAVPKLVSGGGANLVVLELASERYATAVVAAFDADERFGSLKVQSGHDYLGSFRGFELVDRFAWGISFIAALVGAIGVANTMIMSVFERTREIGLLRSVGWTRGMIVRLIMAEGVILSVMGGVLGIGLGLLLELFASRFVLFGWLDVYWDPVLFGQAILLAAVLGVGGSIYPGLRAASLSPTEALRYE